MRLPIFLVIAVSFVSVGAATAAEQDSALVGLHELRREGSSVCMVSHYHYGGESGARTRKQALAGAIAYWRGFTAAEYGNHWGSWRRAQSKSVNCEKSSGGWSCGVEARPCKPLRRRARR